LKGHLNLRKLQRSQRHGSYALGRLQLIYIGFVIVIMIIQPFLGNLLNSLIMQNNRDSLYHTMSENLPQFTITLFLDKDLKMVG
jgi:hypothetical protein